MMQQIQNATAGTGDPNEDRTRQLAALEKAVLLAGQERDVSKETDEAVARRLQNTFELANLKQQFPALTEEELAPLRKILQETFNLKEAARGRKDEEKDITKRIDICKEIVIAFGLEGLNNTMNKFNGK